jgi:hypothetical protein
MKTKDDWCTNLLSCCCNFAGVDVVPIAINLSSCINICS